MAHAIQDLLGGNHCWGCGTENPDGLQIRSYPVDGGTRCDWKPWPRFAAGPPDVLNGGIVATLFDCHGICTAIADYATSDGVALGSDPELWAVTAGLEIAYRAPTPLAQALTLWAQVSERGERKRVVDCRMESGGETTATARVIAVRVRPGWTGAPPAG